MSFTKISSTVGGLAGLGFGIFAATQNYNIENQADSMAESTRHFSELLTQTGMVAIQSASLSLYLGLVGAVLDCITCCKFLDKQELSLPI